MNVNEGLYNLIAKYDDSDDNAIKTSRVKLGI